MKKQIIYLLGLIIIGLYSCTPTSEWDDMYDALEDKDAKAFDAKYGKQLLTGTYTFTDADYAASDDENVKKFKNFSFSSAPKVLIPKILNKKYYADNKGEEVAVIFDYYSKVKPDEANAYTLSDDDYKLAGQKYSNFSSESDAKKYIPAILNLKPQFSTKIVGSIQTVEWMYYYSTSTEYIKVTKDGDNYTAVELNKKPDEILYTLTDKDYEDAGQSYPNFSDVEDAKAAIINIAKSGKGPGNYAYTYYEKRTESKYIVLEKLDAGWSIRNSVTKQTMLFKYTDKFKWVFVPPIKYILTNEAPTIADITLTDADYELTGDGKYKNFYVKGMSEDEQNDVILGKLTIILKANYNIKLNDVVKVTFKVYTGSGDTWSRNIKAVEDN